MAASSKIQNPLGIKASDWDKKIVHRILILNLLHHLSSTLKGEVNIGLVICLKCKTYYFHNQNKKAIKGN